MDGGGGPVGYRGHALRADPRPTGRHHCGPLPAAGAPGGCGRGPDGEHPDGVRHLHRNRRVRAGGVLVVSAVVDDRCIHVRADHGGAAGSAPSLPAIRCRWTGWLRRDPPGSAGARDPRSPARGPHRPCGDLAGDCGPCGRAALRVERRAGDLAELHRHLRDHRRVLGGPHRVGRANQPRPVRVRRGWVGRHGRTDGARARRFVPRAPGLRGDRWHHRGARRVAGSAHPRDDACGRDDGICGAGVELSPQLRQLPAPQPGDHPVAPTCSGASRCSPTSPSTSSVWRSSS